MSRDAKSGGMGLLDKGEVYQMNMEAVWFSSSVPTAMDCVLELHAMERIGLLLAVPNQAPISTYTTITDNQTKTFLPANCATLAAPAASLRSHTASSPFSPVVQTRPCAASKTRSWETLPWCVW